MLQQRAIVGAVSVAFAVAGLLAVSHVDDVNDGHSDCSMCVVAKVIDEPACDTSHRITPDRARAPVAPVVPLHAGPVPIAATVGPRGPPARL